MTSPVSYRDLVSAFRSLGLGRDRPVLMHASLSSFGQVRGEVLSSFSAKGEVLSYSVAQEAGPDGPAAAEAPDRRVVRGGADTLVGALLATVDTLLSPAFTFQTMLIPEEGPEDNGIEYGSGKDLNKMAEFFRPDMPVDPLMGVTAETVRCHSRAQRSDHPILSFTGINAGPILAAQTLADPLGPIGTLLEQDGWVLLLGVDHTTNTSIHYAEKLAGRKQFLRWALTPEGVRECPGYPGCSDGFQAIAPLLEGKAHETQVGGARITAIALADLIPTVQAALAEDPLAFLCERAICPRCTAVRKSVQIV